MPQLNKPSRLNPSQNPPISAVPPQNRRRTPPKRHRRPLFPERQGARNKEWPGGAPVSEVLPPPGRGLLFAWGANLRGGRAAPEEFCGFHGLAFFFSFSFLVRVCAWMCPWAKMENSSFPGRGGLDGWFFRFGEPGTKSQGQTEVVSRMAHLPTAELFTSPSMEAEAPHLSPASGIEHVRLQTNTGDEPGLQPASLVSPRRRKGWE